MLQLVAKQNKKKYKSFEKCHAKFMQIFIKTIVSLAFMLFSINLKSNLHFWIFTLVHWIKECWYPGIIFEMLSGETFAVKHYESSWVCCLLEAEYRQPALKSVHLKMKNLSFTHLHIIIFYFSYIKHKKANLSRTSCIFSV